MPENMATFLKFLKDCESFYLTEQRNKANPIVVHCLNGVSRSAVFMLLYNTIQSIDTFYDDQAVTAESSSLSVADLVLKYIKLMRGKRKYMIHTINHLRYAYDCLLFYMRDLLVKNNVIKEDYVDDVVTGEKQQQQQEAEESSATTATNRAKKSVLSKSNSTVLNLTDVCDPNKFCLDSVSSSGDEASAGSRRKSNKITKNDFYQNGSGVKSGLSDPFSLIDSFKK